MSEKTIIYSDKNIGCQNSICIRPEMQLVGDILRDPAYTIKLTNNNGFITLDISKKG